MDFYNDTDQDIQMEVYTISDKQDDIINVVNLTAKSWTRVKLLDVGSVLNSSELRFGFANGYGYSADVPTESKEYDIYISRFAYSPLKGV